MNSASQGVVLIYNKGQGWDARVSDGRTGEWLQGDRWLGQLYYLPPGSELSDGAMVPVPGAPAKFATGHLSGIFDPEQDLLRVLSEVPSGQAFYVQFRVWNAEAGATYEEAAASRAGVVGKSNMGRGFTGSAQHPGTLEGFTRFSVFPVSATTP